MKERKQFHPQSFAGIKPAPQSLGERSRLAPPSPAPKKNWPFALVVAIGALVVVGGIFYVFLTPSPQVPPATTPQPEPAMQAPWPQRTEAAKPVLILWYVAKDENGKEGQMIPFSALEEVQNVQKRIKKITVVLPSVLGEIANFQVRFQKPVNGKFENLHGDWEFTPYVPMGPGVYEISGTLKTWPNISLLCYLKIIEE